MVKASASRAEDPGFESRLRRDFSGVDRVIPVTSKLVLQWLPCQAPGDIGSMLGLVGPVSVYCDWVRWNVWPAICISVWQHVKVSEQIRPLDTLACCWDVKQASNQQTNPARSSELPLIVRLFLRRQKSSNRPREECIFCPAGLELFVCLALFLVFQSVLLCCCFLSVSVFDVFGAKDFF